MFTLSSKVAALWEFRVLFRFEATVIFYFGEVWGNSDDLMDPDVLLTFQGE
jgi:hypothetical protein